MYLTTIIGDENIATRSCASSPETEEKNKSAVKNDKIGSCLAIMVLRQYADRVRDAILYHGGIDDDDIINKWETLDHDNEEASENKAMMKEGTEELVGARKEDAHNDDGDRLKTKKRPRSPSPNNTNGTLLLPQNQQHRHSSNRCTFIPTPFVKGGRKARTGYILLLLRGVYFAPSTKNGDQHDGIDKTADSPAYKPSISDLLPPIARQQISWVAKLTTRVTCSSSVHSDPTADGRQDNGHDAIGEVARGVYEHLISHHSINLSADKVRVDTYPKELSEKICKALQQEATLKMKNQKNEDGKLMSPDTIDENDPYSGPITLTKSATLAAYVVTVIQHQKRQTLSTPSSSDQSSTQDKDHNQATTNHYYWGISTKEEHWCQLNGKLNDHAASDVWIEPTDPNTGEDLILQSKQGDCDGTGEKKKKKRKMYIAAPKEEKKEGKSTAAVPINAPVSRAYYKLAQVWDDLLFASAKNEQQQQHFTEQWRKDVMAGSGLDLGAAPGGWTQVLRTRIGLSKVVSIDPGVLAQRVCCLPNIHHIRSDFTLPKAINAIAQHAPYSWIVCDASIDSNELLPKITSSLEKAATVLTSGNGHKFNGHNGEDKEGTAQAQTKETKENSCTNVKPKMKALLSLPAVMVITLKLPYKTASSLERNLQHVLSTVPHELKKIASIASMTSLMEKSSASRVEVSFRIVHLMANSDSERTIVAIFEEEKQVKEKD